MQSAPYNELRRWFVLILIVGFSAWLGLSMHVLGFRFLATQPEIELDYVMGTLWWCVLALVISLYPEPSRHMLLVAWIGKFFVVLVAMLVYEYVYGLDGISYHNAAKTGIHDYMPEINFHENWVPSLWPIEREGEKSYGIGTENIIRFMVIIAAVTGPFYHAMKVVCAFLGLMGIWWFYRAVVVVMGRPCPAVFYLLAFFPSILFWSSILGKDPIQFFFLGLYAYGGALWLVQGGGASYWLLGIGLLGSYLMRPWVAEMAGATLVLAFLISKSRPWQIVIIALAIVGCLGLLGTEYLAEEFLLDPDLLANYMGGMQQGLVRQGAGGSGGETVELTNAGSLVRHLPWVVFTGLFRPLPLDVRNPFTAIAAIENTVILSMALMALFRLRRAYLRDPLILWAALYSLVWAAFYGFIVMANFGAGARYKLQTWPFLLLMVICLGSSQGRTFIESRTTGKSQRISNLAIRGQES